MTARSARWLLVLAAILWSSGSLFMRLLQRPTALGLDSPPLSEIQIAFYRALFAGLCLVPLLRRADIRFRPAMGALVGMFAVMNALYVSALGLGSAANAIFLQNSSPVWVFFLGWWLLREKADRRSLSAILIAFLGVVVIVAGNWPNGGDAGGAQQIDVLLMGIGSGATYAGVVLLLRYLKDESATWMMTLNLLGTAGMLGVYFLVKLGPEGLWNWLTAPTAKQLLFLAFFGGVQLAAPYVIFARSLRSVSPNEASIITLLEPVLNPLWAYLIDPQGETPTWWTVAGGALLLAALAWRYAPRRSGSVIMPSNDGAAR
ncbi:MAG: EamA family transporter [Planctomycetia bacterium]|nr:EamA family transporter [Planctomycetia bacterium]